MGSQNSKPEDEHASISRKEEEPVQTTAQEEEEDDDEPDDWDKRIFSTGCADENEKMRDCYVEKKDWRACSEEMERFKQCWKLHGNDERTATKDVKAS